MLKFHASIHAAAEKTGARLATFDDTYTALASLPRLFIEPDGSFVWTGISVNGQRWQVDGSLIDRGDFLQRVEVKGICPPEQFDQLLAALGWPEAPLGFQLVQRGVSHDEVTFRRLAASARGAI